MTNANNPARPTRWPETARRFVGWLLFGLSASALVVTAYVETLQPCTIRDGARRCGPLTVETIAPLLGFSVLLLVPDWTEISFGNTGIKRQLARTQQTLDVTRQQLELVVTVRQVAAESEAPSAPTQPNVAEVAGQLAAVVERLRAKATAGDVTLSVDRSIRTFDRVAELVARHPNSVAAPELSKVLQRAQDLANEIGA